MGDAASAGKCAGGMPCKRRMHMRRTNINAVLKMVRQYLDGEMSMIDFVLDFPYEMEKRYLKMQNEDEEYADRCTVTSSNAERMRRIA